MYIPKDFLIQDEIVIYDLMEQYSFVTLISQHEGAPFATHLPLTLNRSKKELYGHFARPNSHWKDIEGQKVLAIFHGPHCYISPTWYETNQSVPTWNYVTIHVYGQLTIIDDAEVTMDLLNQLVKKYEGKDSLYKVKEADSHFIESLSKGIVTFKLSITKMEAKAKLSQNHTIERKQRVINQLEHTNKHENLQVAALMKQAMQEKLSER